MAIGFTTPLGRCTMIRIGCSVILLMAFTGPLAAQGPEFPPPPKESEWLQHFVGEWETDAEAMMGPGQPPMKCKGTAKARSLGGYWIVSENTAEMLGTKVNAVFTVGYDPAKKKYVGTWIDSMTNHMWKYEGSLDDAKKMLTLDAEGPSFTDPKKTAKFKDAYEVKSKDHLVLTGSMQGDDGKWVTFMTANYKRKK
jgi:hypothetical protein